MLSISHTEDPRPHWDRFRRRELYAIASLEKIPFVHGSPATAIIQQLVTFGVDPMKYMPSQKPLGQDQSPVVHVDKDKIKPLVQEDSEEVKVEMAIEDVNVMDLPMPKLRKWCSEHGIKWSPSNKKVELQEAARKFLDG